jgi:hypothetical protein
MWKLAVGLGHWYLIRERIQKRGGNPSLFSAGIVLVRQLFFSSLVRFSAWSVSPSWTCPAVTVHMVSFHFRYQEPRINTASEHKQELTFGGWSPTKNHVNLILENILVHCYGKKRCRAGDRIISVQEFAVSRWWPDDSEVWRHGQQRARLQCSVHDANDSAAGEDEVG